MKMKMLGAMVALAGLSACQKTGQEAPAVTAAVTAPVQVAAPADVGSAHDQDIKAWRNTRVGNLTKPDGWLSLVGLHWLGDGKQSVGKAADSAIVLATGPEHLGVIEHKGTGVAFRLDSAVQNAKVQRFQNDDWTDVVATDGVYTLTPDSSATPGRILIGDDASIALIQRGDKLALRVKDANARTRTDFSGIDYYDIDPSWRIEAAWTQHPEMKTFEIQTVLGTIEEMPSPGFATFTRDGKTFSLHPVLEEGSDELFFIFADRTSGRETYGPGRFLYAQVAKDGKIVLDFNKAYNPPCAFTEFSTCPLPPPENRLDLAVTSGEKKVRGGH